jgi:hypothetical protein
MIKEDLPRSVGQDFNLKEFQKVVAQRDRKFNLGRINRSVHERQASAERAPPLENERIANSYGVHNV